MTLMKLNTEDPLDYTSQDDSSGPCDYEEPSNAHSSLNESPPQYISESRIAAMSKMDPSASIESDKMIEQLLTDLDTSLADER